MKNCLFRLSAIVLALCLIFSLSACKTQTKNPPETEPEVTTEAPDPSIAIKASYDEAAKKLLEKSSLHLDVSVNTTRKSGCEDHIMITERSADFIDIGKDGLTALISDKISLNSTVIYKTETYSKGNLFSQYKNDESVFLSTFSEEDFMIRAMYGCILTSELYDGATYGENENTILFSAPTALEDWVAPDYAELISAEGKAVLENGELKSYTYTVEYSRGSAVISSVYKISASECTLAAEDVTVPAAEGCKLLDNADIPLYLLLAKDTFENSSTVTDILSEDITILSGIYPIIISSYTDNLYMYKKDGETFAKSDGTFSIEDANGKNSTTWTDTYKNGTSTSSVNGGEEKVDDTPAAEYVSSIRKAMDSYMPEISELSKITSTETEEFILIEYEFGKNSSTDWEDYITDTIYSDSSFLDDLSSQYNIVHSGGYISFDKDSLLPTGISVSFSGTHVIDNDIITVTLDGYQKLDISNDQAYYEITGEYPETEKPEKTATPLFYEVTSPDGGKMYLLGTIHIGDDRTAYLPEEIYSALESSDALALEINPDTYMDEVMASNIYTDLYREGTYYSDGSTLQNHLPEELYNDTVHILKMTGNYVSYMEYVRPAALSSIIEYSYYDTSRVLYSYKGVDQHLLNLANEKGMEVRSIENVGDRLNMEVRYSEIIHGSLLDSSVHTTRHETMLDAKEMFDLWCEGNEEKLSEYINEEPEFTEDTTEEEIAEYEKYENIMITERDGKMLEKAKEYLKNKDEVVFFAVGVAHLLSETGLVEGLREAGYTVELVEYE